MLFPMKVASDVATCRAYAEPAPDLPPVVEMLKLFSMNSIPELNPHSTAYK